MKKKISSQKTSKTQQKIDVKKSKKAPSKKRVVKKKKISKPSEKLTRELIDSEIVSNWMEHYIPIDYKLFDPSQVNYAYELYPPIMKINRKIKSIKVEKLFGKYSYNLDAPIESEKLIILYGDNGTGKTTIMRLVFDMLSSADNRGHRGRLAEFKFKKIYIEFTDKSYVLVDKGEDCESLTYLYEVRCNNKIARHNFRLRDHNRNTLEWARVISLLKELDLTLYYLGDDRKLISDTINPDHEKFEVEKKFRDDISKDYLSIHQYHNSKGSEILIAIQRTVMWLREQAFTGVKDGVLNIQSMYEQSIHNVVTRKHSSNSSLEELKMVLQKLEETSVRYGAFGLTPPLNVSNMLSILKDITPAHLETINLILNPYLDSLTARYEAFIQVFEVLDLFQEKINSFLFDKELRISVDRGIQFFDKQNNLLSPSHLSSGEKHLLLLVCTVLSTRNSNAIFLIDEPEISLNVKWQRLLLPTLLSLSKTKNIQFIIATHSIELLTQSTDNVVVLKNLESAT